MRYAMRNALPISHARNRKIGREQGVIVPSLLLELSLGHGELIQVEAWTAAREYPFDLLASLLGGDVGRSHVEIEYARDLDADALDARLSCQHPSVIQPRRTRLGDDLQDLPVADARVGHARRVAHKPTQRYGAGDSARSAARATRGGAAS